MGRVLRLDLSHCCPSEIPSESVSRSAITEKASSFQKRRRVVQQLPNPSIERTRPGKPGRASHVKR
jgi:hypothetical protein